MADVNTSTGSALVSIPALGGLRLHSAALRAVSDLVMELAARHTRPLFDSERYRRHLETAYQLMYERCLAGEAAADFDVPP